MKLFSLNRITFSMLAIAATMLFSCQKGSNDSSTVANSNTTAVTEDEAVTYSDESAQAEASFDDIEDVGRLAADEEATASAVPGGRLFLSFIYACDWVLVPR